MGLYTGVPRLNNLRRCPAHRVRNTIVVGIANWDHTEVQSGLKAGDLVVTSIDREGVEDGAAARLESDSKP